MESGVVEADRFRWDERLQGWLIKETDEWVVHVLPMIFNDRVVISKTSEAHYCYEYGWCYDKGGEALVAAAAWDPDSEDEPVGYKKAAVGHRVRGKSSV